MFRRYLLAIIFVFFFSSQIVLASSVISGFIPGQIWYSKDALVGGDTVRVYTAVWNGESSPLTVHVEFYDKTVILGSRDVSVPATTLSEVSISWKVTEGDHVISAKITSSSLSVSGKKESVTVDNKLTTEDHQFIPVVIKKSDGSIATSGDIIKSQVDKLGATIDSGISSAIPDSVTAPINSKLDSVDGVRTGVLSTVAALKASTQKDLNALNAKPAKASKDGIPPTSSVDKPFTYIKLFFLSAVSFIFGSKIIFYGLLVVLVFLILRFIYRKIRHK
ncbi:MAG: hypothetical protein WCK91_02165 [bacterium]